MLFFFKTYLRITTVRAHVRHGRLSYGASVVHLINGKTGEVLNEYDSVVGREIAEDRLMESPRYIDQDRVYDAFIKALEAGHKTTIREVAAKVIRGDIKKNGVGPDNSYNTVMNRRLMDGDMGIPLSSYDYEYEAYDYDHEIDDDDDDDPMEYIDYSDRY